MSEIGYGLRKTLYEHTGWNPEPHIDDGVVLPEPPEYDLSYLFKKLPPTLDRLGRRYYLGVMKANDYGNEWIAGYFHFAERTSKAFVFAMKRSSSVETSLCNLAIYLAKEGLL